MLQLTLSLAVLSLAVIGGLARGAAPLDLTAAEQAWLERHPRIEIGAVDASPPLGYIDGSDRFVGISADLISALNRRLSSELVVVPGAWQELYRAVAERRLPALMDIAPTPGRGTVFEFTRPYLTIPHVIVGRKGGPVRAKVTDLSGSVVALEHGFGDVEALSRAHPEITLRRYPDNAAALDAVSRGEADAFIGNRAVAAFLIDRKGFADLHIQGRFREQDSVLAIGTARDTPLLRDILQKALVDLTATERQQIFGEWAGAGDDDPAGGRELGLTPAEKAWLADHHRVRVALDPSWAPVEYRDENGAYAGISLDYLQRLEDMLGIHFEPVVGLSWEQAVEAVRTKNADMFASVAKTPQREAYARFTRPYIEMPIRIFAREELTYVGNLENLGSQRVAVPSGYAIHDWLKNDYPQLRLVPVASPAEGLRKVADGDVEAFIGNAVTANYYLGKLALDNVRVAGDTEYANRQAMAVRDDWPILVGILQKALDRLTRQEHQAIYNRWMSIKFEHAVDHRLLWQFGIMAVLVLAAVSYRNRRLTAEVALRQRAETRLRDYQQTLEQRVEARTADLRASEQRYRATFDQAAVGIARVAPDGAWLEVNQKLCEIVGRRQEDLLSKTLQDITHADDLDADLVQVRRLLDGEQASYSTERRYIRPSGEVVWTNLTASLIRDVDDTPAYFVMLIEDITERKRVEDTLDSFFHQPMNLHMIAALDGVIHRVNESWRLTLGHPREELEGSQFLDLVHPDDRQATVDEISSLAEGRTTSYFENRYRHRDGSYRLLAWSASASVDQRLIFAVATDITEQRKAEEKLREAAAVFGNTAEGVMITDLNGNIVDVNDAFSAITGYSKADAIGRNPSILRSGRHDDHFYQQMWQTLREKGNWRGEIWNRRKDGSFYPELLTISAVRDSEERPTGYVGVFADISAIKQTEERLEHLAHHDPLTDLPNRLLFHARLSQSIRHAHRRGTLLALVFIDLDHFKNINDSLGHAAGDALLGQLAERLMAAIRSDDTVARISGDEFVVLLEDLRSAEDATLTVEKLMQTFQTPFVIDRSEVRITASMGLSLYPADGDDAETLLRNADAAMYRAKEDGRNTYQFYTAELTAAAFEHMFLDTALRNALTNNEFSLEFQPQLDLQTGRLSGLEALLRWDHPQQGRISPARFVPIAEQSGLIREIGAWVLRIACLQAKTWLEQGLEFGRIAVNVAGPQIQHGGFVRLVEQTLQEVGLPAIRLELEITEGFVMRRTAASVQQLEQLRALGVEIAIDDFGTGYSSLSYLKQLPIDTLKIDQTFIRDIPGDSDDVAIAEAVIAMGGALQLKVIAEGVETDEQVAFLKSKGCGYAQGYFFSRPLPPDELLSVMQQPLSA